MFPQIFIKLTDVVKNTFNSGRPSVVDNARYFLIKRPHAIRRYRRHDRAQLSNKFARP